MTRPDTHERSAIEPALDCLIVGGGPAGLTAALYLARFGRRFALVDAGDPRAAWIPVSHNIPFFPDGIAGPDILARQLDHLGRHGIAPLRGEVTGLERMPGGGFRAAARLADGDAVLSARHVLLATGSDDVEPDLPDLPQAIRKGLVRYCPICDGYEARGQRIAVIGHGARGLGEAIFLADTYACDVTLLTLGRSDGPAPLELDAQERARADAHGVSIVREAATRIDTHGGRIAAIVTTDGREHRFQSIYSALGLKPRSGLAAMLCASRATDGAIAIDDHARSSVPGLYAAGGVAAGLDQVVIAMGHAAVAATDIHNALREPAPARADAAQAEPARLSR